MCLKSIIVLISKNTGMWGIYSVNLFLNAKHGEENRNPFN